MTYPYTKIPVNTFDNLQMNAGLLLSTFDPTGTTAVKDADIIGATKGGMKISATPSYKDLGEDVDNCPKDTMELKDIEKWECKITATLLTATLNNAALLLGAATVTTASNKVVPNATLKPTDFKDIWFVGDRADGGLIAVRLIRALSGGFSLKTTDKQKGEMEVEFTGHSSLAEQSVIPIEIYVKGKGI